MSPGSRSLVFVAAIAVIAGSYYIGRLGRSDTETDAAATGAPDPGYAALDAEIVETGHDGRERYRLQARTIRQQVDGNVIELEQLEMDYHADSLPRIAGELVDGAASGETWHLTSDQGRVRANGDDVILTGNVVVTGAAPGGGEAISLSTQSLRIHTPTEFIETPEPVLLRWSGHEMSGVGMKADLKAGTLRLESDVHGEFSPR